MLKHLLTKRGENINDTPLCDYPRPSLKRNSYFCLNGKWEFGFDKKEIVVPFCPESLLSGINETFKKGAMFFYTKIFSLPDGFVKDKVFLHFGAVNRSAKVYLNDEFVGEHTGSYLPFSFEISKFLKDKNKLTVVCENDFDDFVYPYGKQCRKRGGMWYTPCSGIWQTVWIESVNNQHIKKVEIETKENTAFFKISGVKNGVVVFEESGTEVPFENGEAEITINNPVFWSPETPRLYYCKIKTEFDEVQTYFAFRTLEIKDGKTFLNGKPYFFNGLLDQGYFSDGIYTPADYKCFEDDILTVKKLGFNMLRKHIKIEPEIFYYLCDKLGMVVFQDMVNNGKYSFFRDTALPTVGVTNLPDRFLHKNPKSRIVFNDYMQKTVALLKSHPSICCWTIFNEGWGQFCANEMYEKLRSIDQTRFIDSASGWFKAKNNDFESLHIYFKPIKFNESDKPIFLSEFGGYSYKILENSFNDEKTYGYKKIETQRQFQEDFESLYENQVIPSIKKGLCATVYTQVSDVEDETNGLLTYDRKVLKLDEQQTKMLNEKLFEEFNKASRI